MPDALTAPSRRALRADATRPARARPRRRRRIAIVVGASLAGLLILGAAAWFVVPPLATNLSSRVVAADTPVTTGNGAVAVTVPAGWVVQHPFLDDDGLLLHSPDGDLSLTVEGSAQALDVAFAALTRSAPDVTSTINEKLGSGLASMHAQADGGRTLLAVVGANGKSATVVARIDSDAPGAYRAAIARVLESVGLVA